MKGIKNTLAILTRTNKLLIKSSGGLYLITLLGSSFLGICTPLNVWVWKNILDITLECLNKGEILNKLIFWLMVCMVVNFLQRIIGNILSYYRIIYSEHFDLYIKSILLKSISKFDLKEFDQHKTHDEIAKANQETTARSLNILQTLSQLIQYIFNLIGSIGLLLELNFGIVGLIVIYIIPSFYVNMKMADRLYNLFDKRFERIRFSREIQNIMIKAENIKEIKVYKLSDFLINKILNIYRKNIDEDKIVQKKIVKNNVFVNGLEEMINIIIKGIIIFIGIKKRISIGAINMYVASMDNLTISITNILGLSTSLYENSLYLKSVFDIMDKQSYNIESKSFNPQFECIEFKNVSFKYPETKTYILKNINCKLKKGKTYALVGYNGSGKTTLIKLLLKLYEPTEGNIYIDGVNLKDIKKDSFYTYVNAVFQDFIKYPFDIKTNIEIGDINKTHELIEIKKAAEYVGIEEFINTLPKKYDTQLHREWKDSVDLSLGQWQKIAIARAFIKNSSLLVLDEPTASIDARSELDIFKKIEYLKKNQLCVFITHRLSNIYMADEIIVLDKGEISESGNYEQLIKKNGVFKELYEVQMNLFQGKKEEKDA